uniref:Uncharacterized protein n=1 Tax=Oryza glaberrima TaxID=4538 RepID=I1R2S1_ORYGL
MSSRMKREVEPPPQIVVRSTGPLAVPTPQAAPYLYGGLWFSLPPTAWLASPVTSHAWLFCFPSSCSWQD